jgi:thiamine pyrophosphokinase
MPRALIFVNGDLPELAALRRLLLADDFLIAADGGTRHILALGLTPSVLIGDLDSLSDENRRLLDQAGTKIHQSPRDKNETDLELALHFAVEAGYRQLKVVAALGGRLDQTLGNLALLTDPSLAGLDIRVDDGLQEAFFTRDGCRLQGAPGDLISLVPWGGEVTGVTTTGLRWPLSGEVLWPYRTRGISNELLDETASVRIDAGLLLLVHRRQINEKEMP